MAYYSSDIIEKPEKFELHYYLRDESHSIDALLRNECEREILLIAKQIASLLDIRIEIESEAIKEGGFREVWKFIGKNDKQLMVILGTLGLVVTLVVAYVPGSESELDKTKRELLEAQKEKTEADTENIKVDTELKKVKIRELKEEQEESDSITTEFIKRVVEVIQDDHIILWHRSNFYKKINRDPKITKVSTQLLNQYDQPVTEEKEITRAEFRHFIIHSDKIGPSRDEEAEIHIIAPVLTKDKYFWRGVYEGHPVSFEMKDAEFLKSVQNKEIEFVNGIAIKCVLHQDRKIDDAGAIIVTKRQVLTVLEVIESNRRQETSQGTKYRRNKTLLSLQKNLFEDPNFIGKEEDS